MDISSEPTPSQANANNNTSSERDEKGRFQKGNRGGPGNSFTRQAAKLRQAALNAVSDDNIAGIIETMKAKAMQGDVAAAKLLLSYSVGKAADAPNPDTLDQHEFQTILNNHVSSAEQVVNVVQAVPIEALLIMIRAMLPALFTSKMQMAKEVLTQPEKPVGAEADEEEEDEEKSTAEAGSEEPPLSQPVILEWMQVMVEPPKPQLEPVQQNAIAEIQKQLQDLLLEVKKQRADSDPKPSESPPADRELLRSLIERMRGIQELQKQETPPIGNGHNGKADATNPPTSP